LFNDTDPTQEALNEIVEVINNASDEVKEAFEQEINVFAGGTEQYVPSGSTITVEKRRTVIAVSAVVTTSPAVVGGMRRKNYGS